MKKLNAERDEQFKKLSLEVWKDVRFPTRKERKKAIAEERQAYTDLVHSHGGKTLGDLLEEQKKKDKAK